MKRRARLTGYIESASLVWLVSDARHELVPKTRDILIETSRLDRLWFASPCPTSHINWCLLAPLYRPHNTTMSTDVRRGSTDCCIDQRTLSVCEHVRGQCRLGEAAYEILPAKGSDELNKTRRQLDARTSRAVKRVNLNHPPTQVPPQLAD